MKKDDAKLENYQKKLARKVNKNPPKPGKLLGKPVWKSEAVDPEDYAEHLDNFPQVKKKVKKRM